VHTLSRQRWPKPLNIYTASSKLRPYNWSNNSEKRQVGGSVGEEPITVGCNRWVASNKTALNMTDCLTCGLRWQSGEGVGHSELLHSVKVDETALRMALPLRWSCHSSPLTVLQQSLKKMRRKLLEVRITFLSFQLLYGGQSVLKVHVLLSKIW